MVIGAEKEISRVLAPFNMQAGLHCGGDGRPISVGTMTLSIDKAGMWLELVIERVRLVN